MTSTQFGPESSAAPWVCSPDEPSSALVVNPVTEQVIAAYRGATAEDVDHAVETAELSGHGIDEYSQFKHVMVKPDLDS